DAPGGARSTGVQGRRRRLPRPVSIDGPAPPPAPRRTLLPRALGSLAGLPRDAVLSTLMGHSSQEGHSPGAGGAHVRPVAWHSPGRPGGGEGESRVGRPRRSPYSNEAVALPRPPWCRSRIMPKETLMARTRCGWLLMTLIAIGWLVADAGLVQAAALPVARNLEPAALPEAGRWPHPSPRPVL